MTLTTVRRLPPLDRTATSVGSWSDIACQPTLDERERHRNQRHRKRVSERGLADPIQQNAQQRERKAKRHRPRKPVLHWAAVACPPARPNYQPTQRAERRQANN